MIFIKLSNSTFIVLILLCFITFFPVNSSAYFDTLSENNNNTITIGQWDSLASNDSIIKIINDEAGWVEGNEIHDEYLFDLIFEDYDPVNPEEATINPLYEDYTINEIIETVELIESFTDSFLTVDESGNPVYPHYLTVNPVELDIEENLKPGKIGLVAGESMQINQVLNTADATSVSPNAWLPIMISLTIESPEGYDLSDFAIELLIDGKPFASEDPMSYRYVLYDRNSVTAKNRAQSNTIDIKSFNNPITQSTNYLSKVLTKNGDGYYPTFYKHQLNKPNFTGSWHRIVGPNYYIGEAESWDINHHQTYYPYKKDTENNGMILNGMPGGSIGELRIEIPRRNPQDTLVIPMTINISRGLEVDENGNVLSVQKTDEILPTVKLKIVRNAPLWGK